MHSIAEWMANQQQIPFVRHTGQLALTDAAHHRRAHPALAIAIWQLHYACQTHMATMPGTIHAYCHNPGAEEHRCPAQRDQKWHSKCRVEWPAFASAPVGALGHVSQYTVCIVG